MPHICPSESGQRCFRYWLVAYPVPSHHLNQCWVFVNWTLGDKRLWNFNQKSCIFIKKNAFGNVNCEMVAILSGGRWVNIIPISPAATIFLFPWQSLYTTLSDVSLHIIFDTNCTADLFLRIHDLQTYKLMLIRLWSSPSVVKLPAELMNHLGTL